MRSLSHAPRSRALLALSFVVGAVASCRIGYQEVGADAAGAGNAVSAGQGAGGASTSGGNATAGSSAEGGSATPAGGEGPSGNGGSGNGGSGVGQSGAGPVTSGGEGGVGLGGSAGSNPGAGGEGGAQTAPPCTSTTACTCDEFGGHSYWFCTSELTWDASEAQCETAGMQLVRVDSQAENDFLKDQGFTHGVFNLNGFAQIGSNARAVAGEWRWADGTLMWLGGAGGMAVGGAYAKWFTGSPSASGAKSCAGMLIFGDWQDRSCTALVPSICESP